MTNSYYDIEIKIISNAGLFLSSSVRTEMILIKSAMLDTIFFSYWTVLLWQSSCVCDKNDVELNHLSIG